MLYVEQGKMRKYFIGHYLLVCYFAPPVHEIRLILVLQLIEAYTWPVALGLLGQSIFP